MRRNTALPALAIACLIFVCSVNPAPAEAASALTRVTTHARFPSILGQPGPDYVHLYEFDMWMGETGFSHAYARRVGAPPYEATTHDSYAPFDVLPGVYGILLHQPEWFVRPAVMHGIVVEEGKPLEIDVFPGLDYVCTMNRISDWKIPGATDPWEWAHVWDQTFIARGTAITHVEFKLAGNESERARISIHEMDEKKPSSQWPQIGPERIDEKLGDLNDNWVGWRSGEVVTVPGKQYSLRIEGQGGKGGLGMLVHRDERGVGYQDGTAYADGKAKPWDIHAVIGSDSDGTTIPYMRIVDIKPGELGGSGVWAQTWKARGKSVAGVDLLVAWGGDKKPVIADMRILQGGPNGVQVGPAKRTLAAWWGPGYGFLGAVWQPGEAQLKPGETYAVEVRAATPSDGYNAAVVNHPGNRYPDGMAYQDGKARSDADLEMTIIEYVDEAEPPKPREVRVPAGLNLLENGGFEGGVVSEDAQALTGWTKWSAADTAYWYGVYGRKGTHAARVIGGSINGTTIEGGYVQQVKGLRDDLRYTVAGFTKSSMQTDKIYLSAIGVDPTGQTDDPRADTIQWAITGRFSHRYEQEAINGIRPVKDSISVWTRGANFQVGNEIFTVDFDDFELVVER